MLASLWQVPVVITCALFHVQKGSYVAVPAFIQTMPIYVASALKVEGGEGGGFLYFLNKVVAANLYLW